MISGILSRINTLNIFHVASIFFLFTLLCYGNTLRNGLFFDDEQFIYNNQAVQTFDLPRLLSKSLSSESGQISNYYRPLLFIGFSLEYQLFNNNGFIYHLDSFLLHFFGGLLLFLLIKKLFDDQLLAFLSTLLFLVHPIQTEAIAYASGRGDPLSFFFITLTLLLALSKNKKFLMLSFLTLTCALFSKEIALMSPGLIFIVILFQKKSFSRKVVINSIIRTAPYAVVAIIYFLLRITLLNFQNTLNFYNSSNIYSSHLLVRLLTFFNLIPDYLSLLIYPKTLFMERDSGVQIITTFTIPIIITLVCIIAVACTAIWQRKKHPLILFSLFWIFITFVPTSGVIPINGIFYEHFLFFPSVGFFLLCSYLLISGYKKANPILKEGIGIVLVLIIFLLCFRTFNRNLDWHDPITFYNQLLRHVKSPRAYNNLAMAYAEQDKPRLAIANYQKAIRLVDLYPESHYNLANAYVSIKNYKKAEEEYKKSLKISPNFYLSYIKLYSIYQRTSDNKGLQFVQNDLTRLGKSNPQFTILLENLEKNR